MDLVALPELTFDRKRLFNVFPLTLTLKRKSRFGKTKLRHFLGKF